MNDKTQKHTWQLPFFTLWTGQAFSLLGSQVVQFALIWWLTRTTGSSTVLATASLVGLLPNILLDPIAGTFVDRWNRRLTMIISDSLVALAVVVLSILFLTGRIQIWHVYLLMFLRSAAGAFQWPALQASTSLMVPKEHLARVQGANQVLYGALGIVSAPLGALALQFLPMQGVLMIDVSTAMIAITSLFFIAVPQPEQNGQAGGQATFWQDFQEGFHYVFTWPGMLIVTSMAMMINLLFTPAFSLLPLLVTRHFGGQAPQLALLESTMGVGMLVGGILLSIWGGFKRRVFTSMFGLMGMGLASLAAGLSPAWAFTLCAGALFMTGFFNPLVNGPFIAMAQAVVEPEKQGRVLNLIGSLCSLMSPIGLMIAGPLSDRIGVSTWFALAGVLTLCMGIVGLMIPAVLKLEEGRPGQLPLPESEPVPGISIEFS